MHLLVKTDKLPTAIVVVLFSGCSPNPVISDRTIKANVGLYSFTKPIVGALMPPVDMYLSQPVNDFSGDGKNIAILARTYKGLPYDYLKTIGTK